MDIQRHLRLFPVPMDGNVLIKWMSRMDTQNILTKDPLTIQSYRWRTDKRRGLPRSRGRLPLVSMIRKKPYLSRPLR